MDPRRRRALRRGISVGVVAAAIVVVVLLSLIWGGVLVLRSNSPTPVTISSVHLVIEEENSSTGPWLGPWSINYTGAEGFPLHVAPGGTWSIVWETIINFDSVNHTISKVSPSSPFTIASTLPALPLHLLADSEGGNLAITVAAPSTPGGTYAVTLIVDALESS